MPRTTTIPRRALVAQGLLDGCLRDAFDALMTLHYWAEQHGDTTGFQHLNAALDHLERYEDHATTEEGTA